MELAAKSHAYAYWNSVHTSFGDGFIQSTRKATFDGDPAVTANAPPSFYVHQLPKRHSP
jgi:hypothetical protein